MNGGLGLVAMVVLMLLVVEVEGVVEVVGVVVEVVGVPVARQVMLPGGRPVSLRSGGGAGKRSTPPALSPLPGAEK